MGRYLDIARRTVASLPTTISDLPDVKESEDSWPHMMDRMLGRSLSMTFSGTSIPTQAPMPQPNYLPFEIVDRSTMTIISGMGM